jgi:gluconolactonase
MMDFGKRFLAGVAALASIGLICGGTMAQEKPTIKSYQAPYPTFGKIERLDPAVDRLLPADAQLEKLAEGFDWSEGPIWVAAGGQAGPVSTEEGGYLLLSDIPPNKIMKWREGEGVSLFMKPSGYTGVVDYGAEPGSNGLTLDHQGHLLLCEHGDRRLSKLTKNGGKLTLADRYQGKRLNSPNDVVVKSNGDIYFTDPPYGLPNRWDDPRRELDHCGVYRLATDGKLALLTDRMSRPNGLAFSPDEKTLYVAQSDPERAIWMAFEVLDDGTLSGGRLLFDATEWVKQGRPGLPDGLKVDVHGNLWATGPGGVHIFSPEGKHLGTIDTGERTANCAWGDDGGTLYITADMYLARIRTSTKGVIPGPKPAR